MLQTRRELVQPSDSAPPLLRLSGVAKSFGTVEAVAPLDLEIRGGDFFAILGPSGCGKTTLLRMIGGFIEPSAGDIFIQGRNVTQLGAQKRPTNMVFQGYGLFPHMTVRQNIAYGLRVAKRPAAEIEQRLAEVIALVHLGEFEHRSVLQLSGGQQQRVALARALIMRPPVLLLDEPLAALDLKLRHAMQDELRRIHAQIGGTFVFVTHDQGEAMSLANRVAVMNKGKLLQVGSPEEIYRHPASAFVATFIGEANVFRGTRSEGSVELEVGTRFASRGRDGDVIVVVRPESMSIGTPGGPDSLSAGGRVVERVFLGSIVKSTVELDSGQRVIVQGGSDDADGAPPEGARVTLTWPRDKQSVLQD